MSKQTLLTIIALFVFLMSIACATPLVYRPYKLPVQEYPTFNKRNAELINGLIGMDLKTLNSIGKRSNAELVNGLLGMDIHRLSDLGRR